MDTQYTVLNPWAEKAENRAYALCPRPETLEGKTIGLYAHFKQSAPDILKEFEIQLAERYPTAKFKHIQYKRDTTEITNDPDFQAELQKWLEDVDVVICGYGDAGSCAMFLGYNAAHIERMGKPVLLFLHSNYYNVARSSCSARFVPNLRIIPLDFNLTLIGGPGKENLVKVLTPKLDEVIGMLTDPLTPEEASAPPVQQYHTEKTFTGTLTELNKLFYQNGFTHGEPIVPPTREAVDEMLKGTNLPPDYVVATMPPMLGKATVEKIAINAVMAGCLPTYMPVMIAVVRAMTAKNISLEGWSCSHGSWFPTIILSGKITKELDMCGGANILTPFKKAEQTIAKAYSYILLNICGIRSNIEDSCGRGHPTRHSVCFGEDYEHSPWEPAHTRFGIPAEDSAVIMFWPENWEFASKTDGKSAAHKLNIICSWESGTFDPGLCLILSPKLAAEFTKDGYDRDKIIDYIWEYSRRPYEKANVEWCIANNHLPKAMLPEKGDYSVRRFWTEDHLFAVVGSDGMLALNGGGDHGGPGVAKIDLPDNWDELLEKYSDYKAENVRY